MRGFACYPLVPWSNRIANATLSLRDGTRFALTRNFGDHPHAIHGVGWQHAWNVARATSVSTLLAFDHGLRIAWPFAFHAEQAFGLHADSRAAILTLTLTIRNDDSRAFPFGLGWHPFFPRNAETVLGFRAETVWQTDETCLPTRNVAVPPDWRFDPPRAIGDTTLDQVFAGWDGAAGLHWPDRNRRVTIQADSACTHLVVFVPPQRDFLAVEPVTHMTDAFNRDARGESDTGTRWLEPGESRSCTMRVVAS